MNSVAKGDTFERTVYGIVRRELSGGRLGLVPRHSAVFWKKGYPSRDRPGLVIVDVSIEMTLPGASSWSLLWAWECKDYRSRVPVDDLEEFWAKLQQIGGVNIKGGFATTAALARGALSFARSKGIAVVRVLSEDRVDWVLHDLSDPVVTVRRALSVQGFRGRGHNIFGLVDGHNCSDWPSILATGLRT
jgi:hypothetical protein